MFGNSKSILIFEVLLAMKLLRKLLVMDRNLNILNYTGDVFENDVVVINLITEHVTWKPYMFNPKYSNDIQYWLSERRKLKN